MKLNCDIGERGANHPEDVALMPYIDIANLACGGHAGDEESVREFTRLAEEHAVQLTAHLSYPDREHFGRNVCSISMNNLVSSLDEQWRLVDHLTAVKFHGALYNESAINEALAETLAGWCKDRGVNQILAPDHSALALCAEQVGIEVLRESFVDRRYQGKMAHGLGLMSRDQPDACIQTVEKAMVQFEHLCRGYVKDADNQVHEVQTDTVCIHSDRLIAIPLAQAIRSKLS